jgi:hypothetical protein
MIPKTLFVQLPTLYFSHNCYNFNLPLAPPLEAKIPVPTLIPSYSHTDS